MRQYFVQLLAIGHASVELDKALQNTAPGFTADGKGTGEPAGGESINMSVANWRRADKNCAVNFRDKIIAWDKLPAWRKAFRATGKKLVVTNGCFDILHLGHVTYLETARNFGDALLVGVNGDDGGAAIERQRPAGEFRRLTGRRSWRRWKA